jgi:hypothetical protein
MSDPLDVDVLAVKYGPVRREGGHVTITASQWHRLMRDLSRESRRTHALSRVTERALESLTRLASYVQHDEPRSLVVRIATELRQALATIEESREFDV